jgi:hypothetical protein
MLPGGFIKLRLAFPKEGFGGLVILKKYFPKANMTF